MKTDKEKNKALDHVRGVCPELYKVFVGSTQKRPQTVHLEHWLRGFGDSVEATIWNGQKFLLTLKTGGCVFFGADGQPLTEHDYQAYNEIVGVNN